MYQSRLLATAIGALALAFLGCGELKDEMDPSAAGNEAKGDAEGDAASTDAGSDAGVKTPDGTTSNGATPTPTPAPTPEPTPTAQPHADVSAADLVEITPDLHFLPTVYQAADVGAVFCADPAKDHVIGLFYNPPDTISGNDYYYYYYFVCIEGHFVHTNTSQNLDTFRINDMRTVNQVFTNAIDMAGLVDGYFAVLKSPSSTFSPLFGPPGIFLIAENKRSNGNYSVGCAHCASYLDLASITGASTFASPVTEYKVIDTAAAERKITLHPVNAAP